MLRALVIAVAGLAIAQGVFAGGVALISPKPFELQQGDLTELTLSGTGVAAVEGQVGNEKIHFSERRSGVFTALVGIDVDARPGLAKLLVKTTGPTGAERHGEIPFRIKSRAFRTESFNVAPEFDRPSAETLAEIRREREAFAAVFSSGSAERLWEGPFMPPVPHEASVASFGSRRVINGAARAPHAGIDLAAPAGTEVAASNHGRVVLAGNFFFAGGSVVLDHGAGLFTMYFHLSELKVGAGAMVKRGDVIGLSGATGRVTGPHLHWGARLYNARVDPLQLLTKISPRAGDVRPSAAAAVQEKKRDEPKGIGQ